MSRGDFNSRPGGGPPPRQGPMRAAQPVTVLFDPAKSDVELFDTLAEKQALAFPARDDRDAIKSAQLRRFFGEVKDLFRRFNARVAGEVDEGRKQEVYQQEIEPLFKMIRSKVAYARRPSGQSTVPAAFAEFLSQGIAKVQNHEQFGRFVRHFEAVVGFMYGHERMRDK